MNIKTFLVITVTFILAGSLHFLSNHFGFPSEFEPRRYRLSYYAYIIVYSSWSIVTVALYRAIQFTTQSHKILPRIAVYIVGIIVWLPVYMFFDGKVWDLLFENKSRTFFEVIGDTSGFTVYLAAMIYTLVYGLCAFIIYYRHFQSAQISLLEVEREKINTELTLSQYQLQALQSQLSPHFLFNALNSISALTRSQQQEAVLSTIANLGELLRYSIEASKFQEVPIVEELEFTENYIKMQQVRFEGQFRCSLENTVTDLQLCCPPFCIHTLVENAFLHGQPPSGKTCNIDIYIIQEDGKINIVVKNTYYEGKHKGLGLAADNLTQRIKLQYGEMASASFTKNEQENEFISTITLPIRKAEDED